MHWKMLVMGVGVGAIITVAILQLGLFPASRNGVEKLAIKRADKPEGGKPSTSEPMPPSMYDSLSTAVRERFATVDFSGGEDAAINATMEYIALIADNSPDSGLALAYEVGAKPDAELVARSRGQLAVLPERIRPQNSRAFTDIQVIRWWYSSVIPARWSEVSPESITAIFLPNSKHNPELDAFFHMNPPEGFVHSSKTQFLFPLPGLLDRVRTSQVNALLVSIEVTIERGDKQRVTLLLGEHEPGKWYPVAHRTDSRTKVQPFAAERAPRPG